MFPAFSHHFVVLEILTRCSSSVGYWYHTVADAHVLDQFSVSVQTCQTYKMDLILLSNGPCSKMSLRVTKGLEEPTESLKHSMNVNFCSHVKMYIYICTYTLF